MSVLAVTGCAAEEASLRSVLNQGGWRIERLTASGDVLSFLRRNPGTAALVISRAGQAQAQPLERAGLPRWIVERADRRRFAAGNAAFAALKPGMLPPNRPRVQFRRPLPPEDSPERRCWWTQLKALVALKRIAIWRY